MYCLKCGRETGSSQVFCDNCLAGMKKYPVKASAAVHLPKRDRLNVVRKPVRYKRTPEEQVVRLKKQNRWLTVVLILLALLLVLISARLIDTMYMQEFQQIIGKNYTITPEE